MLLKDGIALPAPPGDLTFAPLGAAGPGEFAPAPPPPPPDPPPTVEAGAP